MDNEQASLARELKGQSDSVKHRRAANVAPEALDGLGLPGDTSVPSRH